MCISYFTNKCAIGSLDNIEYECVYLVKININSNYVYIALCKSNQQVTLNIIFCVVAGFPRTFICIFFCGS